MLINCEKLQIISLFYDMGDISPFFQYVVGPLYGQVTKTSLESISQSMFFFIQAKLKTMPQMFF